MHIFIVTFLQLTAATSNRPYGGGSGPNSKPSLQKKRTRSDSRIVDFPVKSSLMSSPSRLGGIGFSSTDKKDGMTSRVEIRSRETLPRGILPGKRANAGIRKLASQTEPSPLSSPHGTPSNSSSVSGSTHLRCCLFVG